MRKRFQKLINRYGMVVVVLILSLPVSPLSAHEEVTYDYYNDYAPYEITSDGLGSLRSPDGATKPPMDAEEMASVKIAGAPPGNAKSYDRGNIAVIPINEILVLPRNIFDLDVSPSSPLTIRYTPVSLTGPNANKYTISLQSVPFDSTGFINVPMGDDDFRRVSGLSALNVSFPFVGVIYDRFNIFVNSNGIVTFGNSYTSRFSFSVDKLISGLPAAAPLFADLNRTACGTSVSPAPCSIQYKVNADLIRINWIDVPKFGTDTRYTFQVTLYLSGSMRGVIDFTYARFDHASGNVIDAVIGLTAGNYSSPTTRIDYNADLPRTYDVGSIYEAFTSPDVNTRLVDQPAVMKTFYKTHGDKYDIAMIFTDFPISIPLGGITQFMTRVRNDTRGLRVNLFNNSALWGSAGELEGVVAMNDHEIFAYGVQSMIDPPIIQYGEDFVSYFWPEDSVGTLPWGILEVTRRIGEVGMTEEIDGSPYHFGPPGLESTMARIGQEVGHRWLVNFPFRMGLPPDPFNFGVNLDLLGRQNAHWTFFLNSPTDIPHGRSMMDGGNLIEDLGVNDELCPFESAPTYFKTDSEEVTDGFSHLDQYGIGVRLGDRNDSDPANWTDEVGDFWYVANPAYTLPLCADSTGNPNPTEACPIENVLWERSRHAIFENSIGPANTLAMLRSVEFCGTRVDLTVRNIQYASYAPFPSPFLDSGRTGSHTGERGFVIPRGSYCPTPAQQLLPDRPAPAPALDFCRTGDEIDHLHDAAGNLILDADNKPIPQADVKTMAFILLVDQEPPFGDAAAIMHVDTIRRTWVSDLYGNGPAISYRGADGKDRRLFPNSPKKFDASLNPVIY